MKLTEKELALLGAIANSEYQDAAERSHLVGHAIWLDYVVDSKSRGGVLSSLLKKDLVKVNIIPMADSDNRQNGISDSTVELTELGAKLAPWKE